MVTYSIVLNSFNAKVFLFAQMCWAVEEDRSRGRPLNTIRRQLPAGSIPDISLTET
jgi:hypothetical protein